MTWCFRIRVDLRATSKLECQEVAWTIEQPDPTVVIRLLACLDESGAQAGSLAQARSVALRGSGYMSEHAAITAGQEWRAKLMAAFAAIRVGADFGDRAPKGGFSPHGLASFAPQGRALNNVHGLMVFECDPPPVFIGLGALTGIVSSPHERLVHAMSQAMENGGLSEALQVSYDLFAASFGQRSADARFALLMMALESMIEPVARSEECVRHVERLIEVTRNSGLPATEIASMTGTLNYLRAESIGQAGRRLARSLEPKRYKDMSPVRFFTEAYSLRSRLLHGLHPLPERWEIDQMAAPMEVFVADLLTCAPAT